MSWHYRDPRRFSALYPKALRAVASGQEYELLATKSLKDLNRTAEQFRWFRWCIRARPEIVQELFRLESSCKIRTKTIPIPGGWCLRAYGLPRLEEHLSASILSLAKN